MAPHRVPSPFASLIYDRELGTLLDYVEAHGLRERTVIILTADHGEEFWDHGGFEHGRTLYEEVLRVPLVVAAPGRSQASFGDLTTVLDVAPTILALAGAAHAKLPGRDLFGDSPQPAESLPIGQMLFGENWSGVRTASCKAIRSEYGEERLFDLESDPDERRNLSAIQTDGCDAPTAAPAEAS